MHFLKILNQVRLKIFIELSTPKHVIDKIANVTEGVLPKKSSARYKQKFAEFKNNHCDWCPWRGCIRVYQQFVQIIICQPKSVMVKMVKSCVKVEQNIDTSRFVFNRLSKAMEPKTSTQTLKQSNIPKTLYYYIIIINRLKPCNKLMLS